jgi:hypothetical protein
MSGFKLQRLGQMMEPEPGNPMEVEGVLNPAAGTGRRYAGSNRVTRPLLIRN